MTMEYPAAALPRTILSPIFRCRSSSNCLYVTPMLALAVLPSRTPRARSRRPARGAAGAGRGDGPADDPARLLELETRFHLDLAKTLGGAGIREFAADLLGRQCLLRPAPDPAVVRALQPLPR